MNDIIVAIQPDGENLRLAIQAGDVNDEVVRQLPALDSARIDELRSGEVAEVVARELSTVVSTWLLEGELRAYLKTALAKNESFRLVFQTHARLLEGALADLPFELVEWAATDPLALKAPVRAIVHLLHKVGSPATPPESRTWPLRILIVRSNPETLGNAVPPAAPIRDHITQLTDARYPRGAVVVALLSNEPGVGTPVTWEALRDALAATNYDILVFLGHGTMIPGFEGVPATGTLQFETASGQGSRAVSASQLKVELQNHPVPVVVLAGCLTAAQLNAPALKSKFPEWMRANQGVAQALVNSESGVRLAVGMRYRLETTDADRFLKAFFTSLLVIERGDVEVAVRAGRADLFQNAPYPPSWSAPVVYRTHGQEPTFDFLRHVPELRDPLDQRDEEYRMVSWKALSTQSRAAREPALTDTLYEMLRTAEKAVLDRSLGRGVPVLMADRREGTAGDRVTVTIGLSGAASLSGLAGRVAFSERTLVARDPQRVPPVRAAGLRAQFQADEPGELRFDLRPPAAPGAAPGVFQLADMPLFQFDLVLGPAFPAVLLLQVDDVVTQPPRSLRGWTNAVIVSPP